MPQGTTKPTAEYDFDLLVIGAGPAGYVAAIRAAQHGLKVACVERRETLGGTCLNVGCIPSKSMLHASAHYEAAASGALDKLGVRVTASLDMTAMHAQRLATVKELTGGIEFLLRKNKVEWLHGSASLTGTDTVRIGDRSVRSRSIVIATGSSVAPLPGVEIDQSVVIDSTGALELAEVPGHMVVIGGGVIGIELGSVWRRLGARVTIVEYLDQILPGFDGEVRKESCRILGNQGLGFRLGSKVTGVSRQGRKAAVTIEAVQGGTADTLEADIVLVAIGRRPNTDGLGLETIGLATNELGQIPVDAEFRTSVPGIYAIGDVISGPMLAHKAEDEGVAVADIVAGIPGIVNHDVIPSVVYTAPEIAGVGLTEEAASAVYPIKVGRFPMRANSRAKTNHEADGFVKVIADSNTDRVLGVWCIASVAGTMIAQAALAMEFSATSEDIALTCHAHPTHSEAMKEAAMAVMGKPIHF